MNNKKNSGILSQDEIDSLLYFDEVNNKEKIILDKKSEIYNTKFTSIDEDIKKISINFNNVAKKIILNDDLYFETEFSTITSIVLNLFCTEKYYSEIKCKNSLGSEYSSKGTFLKIGWIDIHNSGNDYFQLFIRAKLPDYFLKKENESIKAYELFNFILKNLGFSDDVTYEIEIDGETQSIELMNRDDILT